MDFARRLLLSSLATAAPCALLELLPINAVDSRLLKALLDSGVHGAIGAAAWLSAVNLGLADGQLWLEARSYRPLSPQRATAAASDIESQHAPVDLDKHSVKALVLRLLQSALLPPALREQSNSASASGPPLSSVRDAWLAILIGGVAAAAVSCSLDVDHFIAARSLSIKDATSLPSRPFGHAVLFIPAVAAVVSLLAHPVYALMIVTSWGSHQLRDGLRRGLWLWPAGSTPPLSLPLYCAGCALLSVVTALGLRRAAILAQYR